MYLYIMCGLPYAGKTMIAKRLTQLAGMQYIELDAINDERGLGLDGQEISRADWETTYAESYRRLEHFLRQGQSVIYDATSFAKEERNHLRSIAEQHGAASRVIYVDVPVEQARERMLKNRATLERKDVRDQDFDYVLRLFTPPTEDEQVIRYEPSMLLDEWINQMFLQPQN